MADKWPLATGNWSNAANWNGGTKPVAGDTVYADGKTLTIDENINIGSGLCTTETRSGGTAGGSFVINNNLVIVANFRAGTTNCISSFGSGVTLTGNIEGSYVSAARSGTANIGNSSVINGNILGGTRSDAYGAYQVSTTGVVVNGNIQGGPGGGASCPGISSFTGSMVVNGNVLGGTHVSNDNLYQNFGINGIGVGANLTVNGNLNSLTSTVAALRINATAGSCLITVNGNAYAGTQSQNNAIRYGSTTNTATVVINGSVYAKGADGINFQGTGSLIVTGDAVGGVNGYGVANYSIGGTVRVYGTAIGNDWGLGYASNSGFAGVYGGGTNTGVIETITSVRSVKSGSGGQAGIAGRVHLDVTSLATTTAKFRGNPPTFTEYTLATAENLGSLPSNSDVRLGTVFNFGTRTGTLAVPPAASVAVGVPVDNTVGTAAITAASISSALADEFASVLSAIGNIEVDNAAIASAVRSELEPELDHLDADISSRLAADSYTPPSGSGARSVSITVLLDGIAQQSALVRLTKEPESYLATTDEDGLAEFSVNDGTWRVSITLSGTRFTPVDLVVDGNEEVSYSLTANSAIAASDTDMITGYWLCLSQAGTPETGVTVTLTAMSLPPNSTGLILDSASRSVTTGADGIASFTNLIPGVRYKVKRNSGREFYFVCPDYQSDPVDLASFIGT